MSSGERDPVKLAPRNHKVLVENERVRVFEAWLKKGEKLPMHSHPQHVIYMLTNGKVKSTSPDGSSKRRQVKAGATEWSEPRSHAVENLGGTFRWLTLELKESKS
jgi:quercetin dioxygenase-like cupin family protein